MTASTPLLNINERRVEDVTILDLAGNVILGGGSAALRDAIRRLIDEDRRKIVLNFAGIKYMDSSGIGELVGGQVTLNRSEGQLKLINLSREVEEVLALSSLLSVFDVCDGESEALKDFR